MAQPLSARTLTQSESRENLNLLTQDGNQMAHSYVLVAMDWMAEGNCNNHPPAVFFPSDGVGVEVAKKICGTCPVEERCLEYALSNRIDHGVWGGTSERQRRRILKARRQLVETSAD